MLKESLSIYESIATFMSKYHRKRRFSISVLEELAYKGEDGLLEQFIIEDFIEAKEKDELVDGLERFFIFDDKTMEYLLPRKVFQFFFSIELVFQTGYPYIHLLSNNLTTLTRLRNIVELNDSLYFDSDCLIEYLYENQIGEEQEQGQKNFNLPWRIDYFDIYDNNKILPMDKVKLTIFYKFIAHPEVASLVFDDDELMDIKNCISNLIDNLKHYSEEID